MREQLVLHKRQHHKKTTHLPVKWSVIVLLTRDVTNDAEDDQSITHGCNKNA